MLANTRPIVSADDLANAVEDYMNRLHDILQNMATKPQGQCDDLQYGTMLRAVMERVAPKIATVRKLADAALGCMPMIKARQDDVTSHLLKGTPRQVIMPQPAITTLRPIPVAPGYFIEALPISALANVRADGRMYYIESRDLFACIINGVKYCGNIGEVVRLKQPERVTKCQRADCSGAMCNFYHPQKQTRNWKEMHMRYLLDREERLLGSRSNIPEDMARMDQDSREMFIELGFHYFLLSQMVAFELKSSHFPGGK